MDEPAMSGSSPTGHGPVSAERQVPPITVVCQTPSSWRVWRRVLLGLLAGIGLWHLAKPAIEQAQGNAVAVLPIQGALTEAKLATDAIDRVQADPRVKALVIRIDSPGGDVAVAQEIASAIKRVRATRAIPVVASIASIGASGGYYVATAADAILAQPGSLTGSIGVIVERTVFGHALSRYGIRREVLKTGPYKDAGSPWRAWSSADRRMLGHVLNDVYEQFVSDVAAARKLPLARVRALADGRLLSGKQALEAGLIDRLGSLRDAITLAAQRAGLPADAPRVIDLDVGVPPLEQLRRALVTNAASVRHTLVEMRELFDPASRGLVVGGQWP